MKKAPENHPDESYELICRPGSVPPEADFCLSLSNDCMEPYIKAGEMVCVQAIAQVEEFEVAVFLYGGQVYCRQWCQDYSGAVHLLCTNPARQSENITVPASRLGELECLGRVLLRGKLPPPVYD